MVVPVKEEEVDMQVAVEIWLANEYTINHIN
jgi:hypothetical protein